MRDYEALVIFKPDLEKDAIEDIIKKIEKIISKGKGSISKVDHWGKKKLAYLIKKHTHGYYVIISFKSLPETAGELENLFRLSDEVIRHLLIKEEG